MHHISETTPIKLNAANDSNRSNLFGIAAAVLFGPLLAFFALVWNSETLLVCVVFFIVCLAVFFKTELGLYLIVILMPIGENFVGFQPRYPWAESTDLLALCSLIILPTMAGVLMRKIAQLEDACFDTQIDFFVTALLSWAFVGIIWAPNFSHSLFQFYLLLSNVLMFYLFVSQFRKSEAVHRRVLFLLISCAVILALGSSVSMHFLKKDHYGFYFISKSISLNYAIKHSDFRAKILATPNNTACFLNIAVAFSIGLLVCVKKRIQKIIVSLIIVLLVFGVLETKSKAGVGSLIIIGMFSLLSFHDLRKRFIKNFLVFSGVILLLFILQIMNDPKGEPRIVGSQEMSWSARLKIWERGLHDVTHYAPGWGLGIGGLRYYRDPLPHGHSVYFSTFFDFGLLGGFLLIGMIIVLISIGYQNIPYQDSYSQIMCIASIGSLLAVGIHGLVDFTYVDFPIWFPLGASMGTILLVREQGDRSCCMKIP